MNTNKKIKKENISQELIFVMYFWGFALLRPVLQRYESSSTKILFLFTLILVIISTAKLFFKKIYIQKSYALIIGVLFILYIDYVFRPNSYISQYIYEFIIFGVIPVHFFTQVKNLKKMLNIFSYFSAIVFLLYFMDPIKGYAIFNDYMEFGFNLALPAYFGLHVGRRFFHHKYMMILEIICLIEILVCANRSASLSVVTFWVVLEIFYIKGTYKKISKMIIFVVSGIIVFSFIQDILHWAIYKLSKYGFVSYSLWQIYSYLSKGNFSELLSGRGYIWELAKDMVTDSGFIGLGTGAFQARYLSYTHNLYYDLRIQYGLLGLIVFIILVIKAFKKIFQQQSYNRLAGLFFFCLWFPKLFFSTYLFKEITLWCFLTFALINFNKSNEAD